MLSLLIRTLTTAALLLTATVLTAGTAHAGEGALTIGIRTDQPTLAQAIAEEHLWPYYGDAARYVPLPQREPGAPQVDLVLYVPADMEVDPTARALIEHLQRDGITEGVIEIGDPTDPPACPCIDPAAGTTGHTYDGPYPGDAGFDAYVANHS